MPIQQTKRQSDLEKRLKLLRQQVYGKPEVKVEKIGSVNSIPATINYQSVTTDSSDVAYLRQDLLKILLLSAAAFGTQFLLFGLTKNHVLNLNFF